jgi:sulfide dehydrogenase [flavocytochrome c] flavoprotein subunit
MTGLTRRQFGLFAGASAAALSLPTYLRAQGKPRVVVIGGGAGGATAARYIAKDSDGAIDVTLIDDSEMFTTCFFSNLYVGGYRSFESITHSYDTLQSNYGITKVTGRASSVDRAAKTVMMADGSTIPYDRLVVSPGIDLIWDSFRAIPRKSEIAPHAWKAGTANPIAQGQARRDRKRAADRHGAPPNPYRCPPGPYERASMMAHVLKEKGFTDAKVIILDPKPKFSKQGVFQEGWEKHYPGMIEWYGPDVHGGIESVDVNAGTVETGLDTFKGAMMNVIPAQKAG